MESRIVIIEKRSGTGNRKRRGAGGGARGAATEAAYTRLRELAHTLGADARLPSVRSLCEQMGVSQSTMGGALLRLEQQQILVRRERSGVFVAPRLGERRIALICSSVVFFAISVSPFWNLLVENARRRAEENRISLSVALTDPPLPGETVDMQAGDISALPASLIADIQTGRIHGVLAVHLPKGVSAWIEAQGVPVVAYAGAARFILSTPPEAVVQQGVAALIGRGCRRIAYWRSAQDTDLHEQAMFAELLAAAGLPPESGEIVSPPPALNAAVPVTNRVHDGWDSAWRCFGPPRDPATRPDGIVSRDEMITQGGLMALHRLGVVVGRDVEIATHANRGSPALLGWEDNLWRIEYDVEALVKIMLDTLVLRLDGATEQAALPFAYIPPDAYSWGPAYQHELQPVLISPVTLSEAHP